MNWIITLSNGFYTKDFEIKADTMPSALNALAEELEENDAYQVWWTDYWTLYDCNEDYDWSVDTFAKVNGYTAIGKDEGIYVLLAGIRLEDK